MAAPPPIPLRRVALVAGLVGTRIEPGRTLAGQLGRLAAAATVDVNGGMGMR